MEIFIEVSHKNREINNNVKIFELILYSINMIQNFMDFQYHLFLYVYHKICATEVCYLIYYYYY